MVTTNIKYLQCTTYCFSHLANDLVDAGYARDCSAVWRVFFVQLFLPQDCCWREIAEGALFQLSSCSGRSQVHIAKVHNLLAGPNLSILGGWAVCSKQIVVKSWLDNCKLPIRSVLNSYIGRGTEQCWQGILNTFPLQCAQFFIRAHFCKVPGAIQAHF